MYITLVLPGFHLQIDVFSNRVFCAFPVITETIVHKAKKSFSYYCSLSLLFTKKLVYYILIWLCSFDVLERAWVVLR